VATVHKRASAKRDLVEQYVYLAEHAGLELAERFLTNAGETFTDLSRNPGMAASCPGARRGWPGCADRVGGFEKFLIFYLPRPGGVSIVRVLHAAQDWWTLLEICK
jgi:toxin ParE1/3/4